MTENTSTLRIPSSATEPSTPSGPTGFSNDGARVTSVQMHADGSAVARTSGVERGVVQDVPTGRSDVMAVRHEVTNSPISMSQAGPKSRVTVPGPGGSTMEMSLASAIAAGFITDPHGPATAPSGTETQKAAVDPTADVHQEAADAAAEAEEVHPDLQPPEAMTDEGAEAALTTLANTTDPADQVAAIEMIAANGDIDPNLIARAASQAGVEPSVIQQHIAQAQAGMLAQAEGVVAEYGFDPTTVFEWAWKSSPSAMSAAIKEHGMNRSTAGYEAIAEEYALNLDTISPDTILNADFGAGVSARRDHTGQIILTKDGQDLTWKSAVRAKLISIG